MSISSVSSDDSRISIVRFCRSSIVACCRNPAEKKIAIVNMKVTPKAPVNGLSLASSGVMAPAASMCIRVTFAAGAYARRRVSPDIAL